MNVSSILLSLLLLTLMSCNGSGTASFSAPEVDNSSPTNSETGSNGSGSSSGSTLTFAGISSVTAKTDRSATLSWPTYSGAAVYNIFVVSGGTATFVTSVNHPTLTYELTGLTPNTSYTYRVRVMDTDGDVDGNTNDQTFTTNLAPNAPTSVAMQNPAASSGTNTSPTMRVGGVISGDTVKVYSDSSCSTLIGSAVAGGTTVDISPSSALSAGNYSFYATSTNTSSNESSCSTVKADYNLTTPTCPSGYILVPANTDTGANNDFCVMQYEAKDDGSGNAISQANSAPWTSINIFDAKTECLDLNALNGVSNKYDLISNAEWMAIARNVENVNSNWTGGSVGSGLLKRGNLYVSLPREGVTDEGAIASGSSRTTTNAVLTLSNGNTIWDLSGNVVEWTDYAMGGTTPTKFPLTCGAATWRELTTASLSTCFSSDGEYNTENGTYDTSDGMGSTYLVSSSTQGYGSRGGLYLNGLDYSSLYGAFYLHNNSLSTTNFANIGFRCVYRP